MAIKNFDEFTGSLQEGRRYEYSDYFGGKSKMSRWLRSVSNNLKWEQKELTGIKGMGGSGNGETPSAVRSAQALFPIVGRLIASSGAAIADFFTKGEKGAKIPKGDVESKRNELLDDWEKKHFKKDKDPEEKDAEKFYKSGVLKGKKYFGREFNPMKPKNDEERQYSEYLGGAMSKYYNRIKSPSHVK